MMEADWIVRIGNARTRLRIGERGKVRELLTPARRHFRREPGLVIGEVQERRAAAPFLAHEQQWDLRADDLQPAGGAECTGIAELDKALADCAVADLEIGRAHV